MRSKAAGAGTAQQRCHRPVARAKGETLEGSWAQEGDTVLLPEFGGAAVKMGDKDMLLFNHDDILGKIE